MRNWLLLFIPLGAIALMALGGFIAHELLFGGATWIWTWMYGS